MELSSQQSSCLCLPGVEIVGMDRFTRLISVWRGIQGFVIVRMECWEFVSTSGRLWPPRRPAESWALTHSLMMPSRVPGSYSWIDHGFKLVDNIKLWFQTSLELSQRWHSFHSVLWSKFIRVTQNRSTDTECAVFSFKLKMAIKSSYHRNICGTSLLISQCVYFKTIKH